MATSLMAFPDVIDNGPSPRVSKLKFGHAAELISPANTYFSECRFINS
jgi:hypothetical protein